MTGDVQIFCFPLIRISAVCMNVLPIYWAQSGTFILKRQSPNNSADHSHNKSVSRGTSWCGPPLHWYINIVLSVDLYSPYQSLTDQMCAALWIAVSFSRRRLCLSRNAIERWENIWYFAIYWRPNCPCSVNCWDYGTMPGGDVTQFQRYPHNVLSCQHLGDRHQKSPKAMLGSLFPAWWSHL